MLISFKFSNYKSFKDEVEFSMEPLTNNGEVDNIIETGYKKSPVVYRTSAIFGANASGKSSFIHAVSYFQGLMEVSYLKRFNEQMEVPAYKLSEQNKNSTFEFEFIKSPHVSAALGIQQCPFYPERQFLIVLTIPDTIIVHLY